MRRLVRQLVRADTVAGLVIAWLAGALGLGLATAAGAVGTVALMALGPLLGGTALAIRHSLDLATRIGNLDVESRRTLETVRRIEASTEKEIKKEIRQTFRQLEALQNLSAVVPASDVLPATRGWAASPDLLVVLVDLVVTARPSLVVECGSGASTLWLALAMRRSGISGRIIALDHDPEYAGKTRDFLARHGVGDIAEVRDAPLESFSLDGDTYAWYARRAWQDLTGIDLLFVDGPPARTGPLARYPALPLLGSALSPAATAVLDDLVVPDMQKTLQLWLDAHPDFDSEILPLEKQAAVLRRSDPGRLKLGGMTRRSEQISLHLNAYLNAHSSPPDSILRELAAETAERYPNETTLPVAPEEGTFLTVLTRVSGARSAIEIGTFTGYSSVCIARGLGEGGRLVCCDTSEEWTSIARKYWEKAGLTDRIELRLGRALDTLRALPAGETFDLAFIDADKISYPQYWAEVVPRVRSGGVILVDNTFSHGRVLDAGNDNPSVIAVRQMNDQAAADERVELIMVPIGDGLTIAWKR